MVNGMWRIFTVLSATLRDTENREVNLGHPLRVKAALLHVLL